jgi:hypothetical protein
MGSGKRCPIHAKGFHQVIDGWEGQWREGLVKDLWGPGLGEHVRMPSLSRIEVNETCGTLK